jgi:hypothetical protein
MICGARPSKTVYFHYAHQFCNYIRFLDELYSAPQWDRNPSKSDERNYEVRKTLLQGINKTLDRSSRPYVEFLLFQLPLGIRLGGSQRVFVLCEEKILFNHPGIETPLLNSPARSLFVIPAEIAPHGYQYKILLLGKFLIGMVYYMILYFDETDQGLHFAYTQSKHKIQYWEDIKYSISYENREI